MRLIILNIWVILVCFQTFQVNAQDFITQWETANAISQLTFKALTTGTVNYTWSATPSGLSGNGNFTMLTPGTVTLSGLNIPSNSSGNVVTLSMTPDNLRRFYIDNGPGRHILSNVSQWGAVPWSSMEYAFRGCYNFNIVATDVPDLSNVTSMNLMFYNAEGFNSNINNWDVSNVTSMNGMFYFAWLFNQPLNNWDVSNVTNMGGMFNGVGLFNTASSFNQPLDNWDVSNVTTMTNMFIGAKQFNQDISNWDISSVTSVQQMFEGATVFNQDLGSWNVSNVTNMSRMFRNATSFNQDLSSWNTSNVSNMYNMFGGATSFNQDLSNWNTTNVINMNSMFANATSFNQNIDIWTLNPNVDLGTMLFNSGMDCNHYTATLVGWQNNNPTVTGRSLGAQGRQYGTSAVAARNALVNNQGWTITGDSPSGAACDALLPIKLVSFIATSKENEVDLYWQTTSEINNHYFEIEHSQNGFDFESIGRKEGAGNSNALLDYHFVHEDVSPSLHYYRLKQVDYDEQFSYSDIVSVFVKREGNDMSIYPNPTKDFVYLSGINEGEYSIRDITNKIVSFGQISTEGISLMHLNAGVYYISLINSTNHQVHRILKI